MKTEQLYHKRLLKFARHIGKRHLEDTLLNRKIIYKASSTGTNVIHFHWALLFLPKVFSHWKYGKNGIPYLQDQEQHSALMNVASWFDLDVDELFHLFLPGHWEPDYAGIPLNENSTPSDLAHNIYEFIDSRDPEYDYVSSELCDDARKKKKTKIVKLNNEYYERDTIKNALSGMRA